MAPSYDACKCLKHNNASRRRPNASLSHMSSARGQTTAPVDVASYIFAVQLVAHQSTLSTPCPTSVVIGTCRGWSGR